MKAILVIDIDEKIHNSNVTSISFENKETIFFMKEVKFKPMPERKYVFQGMKGYTRMVNECKGWNDCIDEILGEEEE